MVDIIVCCYGANSQKYLDDCLLSIQKQTFKEKQVYVISSGDFVPKINGSMDVIHKHYHSRMHFPEAINEGVTRSRSENILLCNDDIIMQKDCIEKMMSHLEADPTKIINPTSTCDNGRSFKLPLGFMLRSFPHIFEANHFTYEQISPHYLNEIIDSFSILDNVLKQEIRVEFTAFYCTLMKRSTWDKVGGIDTALKTGQDDLDFCIRAREIGFKPVIYLDAFCFHYSGATADIHLTKDDRIWNIDYFNEKWSDKGIQIQKLK